MFQRKKYLTWSWSRYPRRWQTDGQVRPLLQRLFHQMHRAQLPTRLRQLSFGIPVSEGRLVGVTPLNGSLSDPLHQVVLLQNRVTQQTVHDRLQQMGRSPCVSSMNPDVVARLARPQTTNERSPQGKTEIAEFLQKLAVLLRLFEETEIIIHQLQIGKTLGIDFDD